MRGDFLTVPFVLMVIVSTMFGAMLVVMAFHDVPAANKDMLNTLLGLLGAGFSGIVGYYFGSSSSSREKDQTISALSTPPQQVKP